MPGPLMTRRRSYAPLLDPMPDGEVHASDAEIAAIRQWGANLPGWEMPGPPLERTLLIEQLGAPALPRRRAGAPLPDRASVRGG
jgi:hypothetical protein